MTASKSPPHLRPTTRAWYRSVLTDFELDPHHERLLQLAAESWDRVQEAREVIAKAGAYFTDNRGTPRAHPAIAVQRDATITFTRTLRELDLDISPPTPGRRPPGRY
jgi:phage terminase small subunit